jgi:hypothetical protein
VSCYLAAPRRPLHFPPTTAGCRDIEWLLGWAPASLSRWPPWNRGPSFLVRSTAHDSVHAVSYWKINLKLENPRHFAKDPMHLSKIKPQSTEFPNRTLESENISRFSPSHFQEFQIGPYNFFSPYLCNLNSNFGDSCAKFLRIIHPFISCIYNTCLLHIDWLCARY